MGKHTNNDEDKTIGTKVPAELWRKWRLACMLEKQNQRDVLIMLIDQFSTEKTKGIIHE